jgi:hypothetical protein
VTWSRWGRDGEDNEIDKKSLAPERDKVYRNSDNNEVERLRGGVRE